MEVLNAGAVLVRGTVVAAYGDRATVATDWIMASESFI